MQKEDWGRMNSNCETQKQATARIKFVSSIYDKIAANKASPALPSPAPPVGTCPAVKTTILVSKTKNIHPNLTLKAILHISTPKTGRPEQIRASHWNRSRGLFSQWARPRRHPQSRRRRRLRRQSRAAQAVRRCLRYRRLLQLLSLV